MFLFSLKNVVLQLLLFIFFLQITIAQWYLPFVYVLFALGLPTLAGMSGTVLKLYRVYM